MGVRDWTGFGMWLPFAVTNESQNDNESHKVRLFVLGDISQVWRNSSHWRGRRVSYKILPDMEQRNSQSTCNNCSQSITWNPQVVHSQTGRMTPLDEPWIPYTKPPSLHRCMTQKRPQHFMRKSEFRSYFEQFPERVLDYYGKKKSKLNANIQD